MSLNLVLGSAGCLDKYIEKPEAGDLESWTVEAVQHSWKKMDETVGCQSDKIFTNHELEADRLTKLESKHADCICYHGVALGDVAHPSEELQCQNSRLTEVGHDTNRHSKKA